MNDAISTKPSRSVSTLVACALVSGALLGAVATVQVQRRAGADRAHSAERSASRYRCPMHPGVVQDVPGECPICGMALVASSDAAPADPTTRGGRKVAFYRSPMDPKQTARTPQKDGMGMDYLPVYEDELLGEKADTVAGKATVNVDPERQRLIGLRTERVTRGPVSSALRTSGRVAIDETRVRKVSVKVEGFVEQVFADFTGRAVRRGDPLFTLYSPELLAAQNDLLLALETRDALGHQNPLGRDGDALVDAARRRLRLWDVPESFIESLEKTRQPSRTLTVPSPVSGVVTNKMIVAGTHLNPGDTPLELTDLSTVWVLADGYAQDLSALHKGMSAEFTTAALPGRTFSGRVTFIDPLLDPNTRTARVRIALENARGELKPELFGEVVLRSPSRQALRLPVDAVVEAGTRHVVFIAEGEGRFRPAEVEVGASDGRFAEVLGGLREGDEVVSRANFLLDSESSLRAALAAMQGGRR